MVAADLNKIKQLGLYLQSWFFNYANRSKNATYWCAQKALSDVQERVYGSELLLTLQISAIDRPAYSPEWHVW